jgi:EAL domain-containing protein (putative c-di-GMP-specific phosphodiesterase class I)
MLVEDVSVMVVEDDAFQRRMLVRLLHDMGVKKIDQAPEGQAALHMLLDRMEPVDIVISDLDMPTMDGMELIRHLGEQQTVGSVILTSGLDATLINSVETMARAYGIDMLGGIEKPVTQSKLGRLIKRFLLDGSYKQVNDSTPIIPFGEIRRGMLAFEFHPYYQPKVDIASGKVVGAEALVRWLHPQQGVIAPAKFIPQMEEGGLVDDLTWTVLAGAATHCRTLRENGFDMTIAVNLSLRSLTHTGIAERVVDILRSADLDPSHIVLEVTETAAISNVGHVLENLARLRMKGFGLAIDDYGTGYSSMQQLSRIPFTELKIDRAFVADAARQERLRVMVGASLDMTRKLGLKSVAEGVESHTDWELLSRMKCDVAQGYFIAKPMPFEKLCNWLPNWVAPDPC